MSGTAVAERALEPVRARLLAEARAEADQITAQARAEADRVVRDARAAAERAIALARAEGEAAAVPLAAAERRQGRARARETVLGAQRAAYEELAERVRAAADELRDEPEYPALLSRLTALATRAAEAAGAVDVSVSVPAQGGVIARAGLTVVDCSLPRLAAQALAALGDQVRELWTA